MSQRFFGSVIVGMLLVGAAVVFAIRSVPYEPTWDWSQHALPATAPAAAADLARLYPDDRTAIARLLDGKPNDAKWLLDLYGIRAPRAYAALGDVGLGLLKDADEMPNFLFYIESPFAAKAKPGLVSVADFLADLAKRDPKRADDLFYCFTRMGDRQAALVEKYPHALPILATTPATATRVIEKFGESAVDMMLRFTPDSYGEIARLLDNEGERVFRVRDLIANSAAELASARQDVVDSFLALYFIDHGDISRWMEQRLGLEQAMFVLSNNLGYLHELRADRGTPAVRAALMAVMGYADSGSDLHRDIAEICFTVPGALPLFVETQHIAGVRDRFLANYARRGGVNLIAGGFDKDLWAELLKAIDADGETLLVPLAVLVENGALHKLLEMLNGRKIDGYGMLEALRAVMHAMNDDGGPTASSFRMVERTLAMMLNNHWADVPDDYLSREVLWVWDVLPGRDAFRLVRMMMNGYSPTLFEAGNGAWDAANVVAFVYSAGTAVVDCTRGVAQAMGEQSFSALARAIGIVAKNAVGHVFERLIQSISQPRNYIRLALVAGYFAYDTFLTYAPMEIPNRARLLEINQKYLTPSMRGMMIDVAKEVGLNAFVWRPEFDHKDWQFAVPPADLNQLSEAQRIAFELARMDARIKQAFVDMLEATDRRRKFLKMLGLAQGFGGEEDKMDDILPPAPNARPTDPNAPPTAPPSSRPPTPPNFPDESEDMSRPRGGDAWAWDGSEPVAYVVVDGRRIPLTAPRFRNVMPGVRPSKITGRTVTIPRDAASWAEMVRHNPDFVAYCLENIVDLMNRR